MADLQSLWNRLTTTYATDEQEARQEYMTKVVLVIMGGVLFVATLALVIGWRVGLFTLGLEDLITLLLMDSLVGLGWWLAQRGYRRLSSYVPPAVAFLPAIYGSYVSGLVTTSLLFYVIAILLTAMLQGGKAQWFILALSICAHLALGWGRESESSYALPIAITVTASFVTIALLQWFSIHLLRRAYARVHTYAQELQVEVAEREHAEAAEKRHGEALQQRNRELALLNKAGQALSSSLDLDQVLATILEEVRYLLDVVTCSVWLIERESGELLCRQAAGPESGNLPGWRLAPGQGLAGWVAHNDQSLIVPDAKTDERHFKDFDAQTGLASRSVLTVPLRAMSRLRGAEQTGEAGQGAKEDVIGVLQMVDTTVDRFGATDLVLAESLATSAASAIENARLYEAAKELHRQAQQEIAARKQAEVALKRRNRELATLYEAATAISSDLSLDTVLETVAKQMTQVLDSSGCTLSLWKREEKQLETLADYNTVWPDETDPRGTVYDLNAYPTTRRVLETGQALVIHHDDPTADEAELALMEKWGAFTLLMLPLVARDQVLGLVELVDDVAEGRDYTSEEVRLAESLAAQAAIAIYNARLYEEAKELHRQAQEDAETKATLLREVNHRVKNNLALIVSLLHAEQEQAEARGQATCQSRIQHLVNRVMGLSTAHKLLSASAWAPLPLRDLVSQVVDSVLQTLPLGKRVSVVTAPSPPVWVIPDQAQNLALVINELTTNSVKYALQERDRARISIRIALEEEDLSSKKGPPQERSVPSGYGVRLEFRDNGPGYPEEVLRLERYNVGLDLIRTIVCDGMQGELALHNDHGAVTSIRFKAMNETSE